jgi:hypothetical protein
MSRTRQAMVAMVLAFGVLSATCGGGVEFRKHVINAESKFEAAGVLDVNKDGKLDIFCGGFWYEGPSWTKHIVREVIEEGGYHYDFANLPIDVDGDGWTDIIDAAWHNKKVFWVRNPGKTDAAWEVIDVDQPGNMETAILVDIDGDKQPDVLPNVLGAPAFWYSFKKDAAAPKGVKWDKHALPPQASAHGNGAGDVDGDGKCDIITPTGWLRQTGPDQWEFMGEFNLGSTSIPILVYDVDGDGDADLFWMEQGKGADGKRTWTQYEIDKSWSQPHFMLTADIDNCGKPEVVVGKRYWAHNGNDPGEKDPLCVYYYKFDKAAKKFNRNVISEGDKVGLGINTMVVDIDGDGDLDVVCPGKSGLFLMENLLKK